ncbi:MAG TPA: twin-arginine translocase subunit TatC [Gemmatimonadales bacterium]|jgi:Tat protein translocase TatC
MANPTGEMPFLDHLEELRKRILLAMAGVIVGVGLGWFLTRHFELIQVFEAPIARFVPNGKLMVTSLIDPFMIVLRFSVVLGLILSSPWVLYQLWLFLAPALTPRERRAILPSLGIGLLLFLAGAAIGWFYVLGPTVQWFETFEPNTFNTMITYDSYLSLVINLLVAMGISAELPLVMILLALLGVLSYRRYVAFRRYAFFLSFVGGAILSPAPEVVSMILFSLPLLLLYEVGVGGAYLVERRRLRSAAKAVAALLFLGLCMSPRPLSAQIPPPPPVAQGPPGAPPVAVAGVGVHAVDSSTFKRLGLPAGPTAKFPSPDSVMQALLDREGFANTRFLADSASFVVDSQKIILSGHAATDRDDAILQAHQIMYDDANCLATAEGAPRMFQQGQAPLIGVTMRFNTCNPRGMIGAAYTSFNELGSNWFVRGNLAVDSSGKRLYAGKSEFTSCDLPDPHYHFVTGQVKWESQSVMVARPAVLFIRDVPVAWLPFMFQDTKPGRRSGILIPRFGFNDIVRPTRTYNRQITNIGYYWAPNDYMDVTGHLDWYANRYTQYGADLNYSWLNRFVTGGLHVNEQVTNTGSIDRTINWVHNQQFSASTSLSVSFNYASNSQILQANALDPLLSTQLITSQVALKKSFRWGQMTIGGTRSDPIGGTGAGNMTLPTLTLTMNPLSLGRFLTWSPSLTATNHTDFGTTLNTPTVSSNGLDSIVSPLRDRQTTINLNTPLTIKGFSLPFSIQYDDQEVVGRQVVMLRRPDSTTADPNDSVNVTEVRNGDYKTGLDWTTSISLPPLLRGSWKLTPSIGVTNISSSGEFLLRTPGSNGQWVAQGKKVALGLTSAPFFFGFINRGIGPYSRFRYTLSPLLSLQWSPAASLPADYARALNATIGGALQSEVPSSNVASITLSQTFEGKLRPSAKDTNSDPAHLPKKSLLSINTSSIAYDFEQAKLPGQTGWKTQQLTNSFTSDLVHGFSLSTTHDLWQGTVGTDSAKFSPFLSAVQANFQLTGGTFRSIGGLFGLGRHDTTSIPPPSGVATAPLVAAEALQPYRTGTTPLQSLPRTGFTATVSYSLTRQRPSGQVILPVSTEPTFPADPTNPLSLISILPPIAPTPQSSIGLTMGFSPTAFWNVSWNTEYDVTNHTFESQVITLQRDLHDWRASFNFIKNPNGNFALTVSIYLISLPDIKFDYNQTTLQQTTAPTP